MNDHFASDIIRGAIVAEAPASPAAGANLIFPCTFNIAIEILAVTFVFTTDATAITRNVCARITGPIVGTAYLSSPVFAHTASLARTYIISSQNAPNTIIYPLALQLAIPQRFILINPWSIGTLIENIQAGDQISTVTVTYLRHALPF